MSQPLRLALLSAAALTLVAAQQANDSQVQSPPRLPGAAVSDAREHAEAIQADYALVRQGLGPCPRNRRRP